MEADFGADFWNSSLEHLKIRNQYCLNKLPKYFEVENWNENLKEGVGLNDIRQE